jgi:hypothetical protein
MVTAEVTRLGKPWPARYATSMNLTGFIALLLLSTPLLAAGAAPESAADPGKAFVEPMVRLEPAPTYKSTA